MVVTGGASVQVVSAAELPHGEDEAEAMGLLDDFTFCGLLSLIDPPREQVRVPGLCARACATCERLTQTYTVNR